jgi:hypothetical protein
MLHSIIDNLAKRMRHVIAVEKAHIEKFYIAYTYLPLLYFQIKGNFDNRSTHSKIIRN